MERGQSATVLRLKGLDWSDDACQAGCGAWPVPSGGRVDRTKVFQADSGRVVRGPPSRTWLGLVHM